MWNSTDFCEHGIDLQVEFGIMLSILSCHFNVNDVTALKNQEQKLFCKFLIPFNECISRLCLKSPRKLKWSTFFIIF